MNPIAEVIGLFRSEFARRVRGWKRSIYAGAVGVVFLTFALTFLLIAIFLFLAEAVGAPAGALIMAAGLMIIGVIALVIASIKTRKRNLQADVQAIAAGQMERMDQIKQYAPSRADPTTLLAFLGVAFAIGLFAGRRR